MLAEAFITTNAYYTGLSHALSTEREEVMGLLLGDVAPTTHGPPGSLRAVIWGVTLLPRSEKKRDRVEIEPEQLVEAAHAAEVLSASTGHPTRVIGWYHSHPRITPYPSHVDLRTQGDFQGMEPGWIGLIYSVFTTSRQGTVSHVQLHAFQSVSAPPADTDAGGPGGNRVLSGLKAAAPGAEELALPSPARDAPFHHAQIPVYIVPETHLPHLPAGNPFHQTIMLQQLFLEEERDLYRSAVGNGPNHQPLSGLLFATGVYEKALAKLIQGNLAPLAEWLGTTTRHQRRRLEELKSEEKELLRQLEAL
eukprot:TRINITY_DN8201_c0_g1_i1.p1 TRINITY_DN8201_c0_g1~~TRINITY_DN8201_c0_g1_i1.p1  ORF type:complete len:307 (+),score=47.38 TRINITY_DN8201_c0_g1_i1:41-961(+)